MTNGRVGLFLEQHREELMVEERHLRQLGNHAPKNPVYFDCSKRESGKLQARWNLVVPEWALNRTWAELA